MNHRLMLFVVALGAAPAIAQVADRAKEAAHIETECRLKKGSITVTGDRILLQPFGDVTYEEVACAIARLEKAGLGKIGFVGNEADPDGVLQPPLRYIAEGSSTQMAALIKAAESENWAINKTATGSDGMTIVQFESGATMTHGQASRLLERIWKKEFGDIAFGMAPRKLSKPDPFRD
jgi:hypothetical protein